MMRLEQIRELSSEEENNRGTYFTIKKKQSADPPIENHSKTDIPTMSISQARTLPKKEIFRCLQSHQSKNLLSSMPNSKCDGREKKRANSTHLLNSKEAG